jgi:hypothetical protein
VLAFEEDAIEPFSVDAGMIVPLIRMTTSGLPEVEIAVGDQPYTYERSYNIKGSSAVMPKYLRELMSQGKKPLVIERPTRYYVYATN